MCLPRAWVMLLQRKGEKMFLFLKRGFQTPSFALEFCNIFGIRQMSSQKNLVRSVSCTLGSGDLDTSSITKVQLRPRILCYLAWKLRAQEYHCKNTKTKPQNNTVVLWICPTGKVELSDRDFSSLPPPRTGTTFL